MPAAPITFPELDGKQAAADFPELRALYSEVYAEPPYEWGEEHADLFAERFEVQRRQEGFVLAEARDGSELAGYAFGVTLQPTTPWWRNVTTTLPPEVTTERPARTFALVEMLVQAPWRRRHVAQGLHDLLLHDRPEPHRKRCPSARGRPRPGRARRTGFWPRRRSGTMGRLGAAAAPPSDLPRQLTALAIRRRRAVRSLVRTCRRTGH